ncbi:hypothetical protein DWF04_015390 [Cereibacter sphaeroides f. sp. denitrificans]
MGLYSDFNLDELRAMRRKALDQRAKGVSEFSYNGQTFRYSSPAQLLLVAEEMTREIRRRMASDLGLVPFDPTAPVLIRPLSGGN